jgi:hypothetical protein
MRSNKIKTFLVCLIFFSLLGNVDGVFESYTCEDGTLSGDNECQDGNTPTVMCDTGGGGNCPVICAAECGSLTGCMEGDCKNCCKLGICSVYPVPAEEDEYNACIDSCVGTCEVNKQFCGVILILQSIAVGLATLMLVVNGFKWMTADDAQGRIDARRGVYYVFIGLAVVIIAFALVNYLFVGEVTCSF